MTFSFTLLSTFLLGPTTNSMANPLCNDHSGYSVPKGKGKSFFCRPPLYGRYVTIRSLLTESLTLCEVEVYSERRGMINYIVSPKCGIWIKRFNLQYRLKVFTH